ncbi:hypothetical protein [Phaeovulum sp.]|uniref:hypothetical protein n=1 Tax=Phaeovulum sp. TaxID=2934796 RepID=UPI002ABC4316|nr:hypothetical protein [Phaeovulum sp.]MDZ4118697.1 hypothetical protein [Phaeovulum sp.]
MNFFDLSRRRDRGFVGLWRTHRGVLLASVGVLIVGTAAALTVPAALRAARSDAAPVVLAALPEMPTLALPRPVLAEPDNAASLLAAVAALSPDPVVVRVEPLTMAAPLPEQTPAPIAVTMSSKALADAAFAKTVSPEIVTALPLPATELLPPPLPEVFAVTVLLASAETPRPALRPAAVAARAAANAPARPQPRPVRLEVAAATTSAVPLRPLPRPAQRFAAAPVTWAAPLRPQPRPALTSLAVATPAAPARPSPRPFVPAQVVQSAAQLPVAPVSPASQAIEEAVAVAVASAAPEVSPPPRLRPARVLLAATAARQAAAAVAPREVQAVALREPVAPPSGALEDALARAPAAADCPSQLARGIPRRAGSAATGSEFGAALGNANGSERDQMIVREVLSGNVPQFLRALTPVTLSGTSSAGKPVTITVCVTPDYVAVGDNADFLRVPMGLPEAAQIADRLGFMLPTTRIVDAVFAQAGVRLAPRPMEAGPQMTSTSYFRQHNATIDGQSSAVGLRNGQLVAGIKKDLVLTNALRRSPGQVAIYGWHQPNGRPIQPLTTVHGQHYSDYSHGVRLVSQTAYLNGRAVALSDLLEDRVYAQIISSEGPIAAPRTLLASLYTR